MKSYLDTLERLGYAMLNELGVSLILNSLNKDYDQFVQNYNMHSMGKTIAELHAMLKLHEKGILKKAKIPAVLAIREGKIQKNKRKPRGAKGKDKGKNKLAYAPKPKILPPPKRDNQANDSICHHYKEVGYWRRNCPSYQAELKKRKEASMDSTSDMQNLYPNGSSTFNVSNKRVKYSLDSSYLCHCHLGHINKKRMDKLQHDGILHPTHDESLEKCKSCIIGKMAHNPFPHKVERAKDLLGLIHTDVFQNEVKNQLGKKIKAIQSDRGGEYLSHEFVNHMKGYGIVSQLTPPYTLQHNGVSERRNQTLLDMVRSMMNLKTLLKSFLGYVLKSAARILNMVPTKKVKRTPYEIWNGKSPKLSYLRVTDVLSEPYSGRSFRGGYAVLGIVNTHFIVKTWREYAVSLFLDTAYWSEMSNLQMSLF
ncbi:retrotransposon protein, putative, ty1-copia subclass [Tanacetum coccineum]|uniref:Retrotransposon protein, putative, ty1-copia subclass n=1 Tax=Tanacetum coccineum TaxID=301880 RepID=A0ABQ4XGM8_9ASTR